MKMTSASVGSFRPGTDVYVRVGDQQKINEYARLYERTLDYEYEYSAKTRKLLNYRNATEELLFIDEEYYPYLPYVAGETFECYNLETMQNHLNKLKQMAQKEREDVHIQLTITKTKRNELKKYLYDTFGSKIILYPEDKISFF